MPNESTRMASELQQRLSGLDATQTDYASRFAELLLAAARTAGASDVHLQPTSGELEVRWRLDGVLQPVGRFPRGEAADIVARLKVLANLLTYRTDVAQEGRLRGGSQPETRISTFPTLHGERCVVRLFAGDQRLLLLEDLGLPVDVAETLSTILHETSGAVIVSGPAGSGKTTTAYACVREVIRQAGGGKSVMSLEDPIEVAVDGMAQSQVNEAAGFTLAAGLKSLLRQDPEVILVGEIRDRTTAEQVFQASLTGHLVVTTFHAGSAAEAITRLADMQIEPFQLRSGLLAIVSQRLLRRLCDCALPAESSDEKLGLPVVAARRAVGCEACLNTGYRGRAMLAEILTATPTETGRSILSREDAATLQERAVRDGMISLWQRACAAVEQGETSPSEVRRVFGFRTESSAAGPA